jgi:hypothetical protein
VIYQDSDVIIGRCFVYGNIKVCRFVLCIIVHSHNRMDLVKTHDKLEPNEYAWSFIYALKECYIGESYGIFSEAPLTFLSKKPLNTEK